MIIITITIINYLFFLINSTTKILAFHLKNQLPTKNYAFNEFNEFNEFNGYQNFIKKVKLIKIHYCNLVFSDGMFIVQSKHHFLILGYHSISCHH